MMMRNRILAVYPDSVFQSSKAPTLFVADFSVRTHKERGVELHEVLPKEPNIPHKDMEHCECCFFPTDNDDKTWVGFIEIKDCKPKNIANFKDKAKEQIRLTVRTFRKHNIIINQKVYGIISFPRIKKAAFDQTIFDDPFEYKRLFKSEKIHFFATNEVSVTDKYHLNFKP